MTAGAVQRAHERRAFLLGAAALLVGVVLLARYHAFTIDRQYASAEVVGLRVNVNTADAETLALLRQIGPERARRIVAWRAENGPFRSYPDLMQVQGIGRKTVEGLFGQVCFDAAGALPQ